MTDRKPLFALVAGEASGDLLGAGLIEALKRRHPNARFVGVGGPKMVTAGLEAWYPAERLAVMGLVEVLRHLPSLLRLRTDLRRRLLELKPDVFVGIDAPDFNLGLERKLKAAGIRTVHYVSPSIWAWREKRARRLGESADLVLCLFPMEPPIYAKYSVAARFVGHPLVDALGQAPTRTQARSALGLCEDAPILAVLPGSRLGEITRLGRDFLGATKDCQDKLATLQAIAPMANATCRATFEAQRRELGAGAPDIRIIDGRVQEVLIAADIVLVASGTAALEAMLARRPMVVAYRLAWLSYRLVHWLRLMRTDRYALPNILAERILVPELMQDACTPPALAETILALLYDDAHRTTLMAEFGRLSETLRGGGNDAASDAITDLL